MKIDLQIEALLFFKNEPIKVKKIATILEVEESAVDEAIKRLTESFKERGIRLMQNGEEIMLVTAPEASELIEKITKEELTRDLGKAGLEVLSIILYKGPISRRDIDYIRGVNSSFIIRNLLVRGLVEKTDSKEGDRSFTYKPTFELLSFMGIEKIEDMPEYNSVQKEIENITETEIKTKTENQDGE